MEAIVRSKEIWEKNVDESANPISDTEFTDITNLRIFRIKKEAPVFP